MPHLPTPAVPSILAGAAGIFRDQSQQQSARSKTGRLLKQNFARLRPLARLDSRQPAAYFTGTLALAIGEC